MMPFSWNYTPVAMPLIAGAVVLLVTAIFAWRRRHVPGALYLSAVGISLAIPSLAYAIELGSPDIVTVRLMYKLYYLGTQVDNLFLPLMLLSYLGRRDLITRRLLILIAVVPLITLVLAWTNDEHQLIWQNIRIERSAGYTVSSFERGVLYILPNGYGLILLLAMLIMLGRAWFQTASGHRFSIALMIFGLLLPYLAFTLYLTGFLQVGVDPSPYLVSVAAVIFAVGMFGGKMFEVLPIMHRSIYRILPTGILIFDSQGRLADINPSAEDLFGLTAGRSIGLEAPILLANWPELVEIYNQPADADVTKRITVRGEEHHLQVRTLRLKSDSGMPSGHTMVLRNITREVRAEEALQLANARLLTLHQVDNDLNLRLDVDYVAKVALDAAMLLSVGDAAVIGFATGDEVPALKATGLYGSDYTRMRLDKTGVSGRVLRNRQAEWIKNVDADVDYISRVPGMKSMICAPLLAGTKLIGIISVETATPERFSVDVFESIQLLAARMATALDNARAYEERDQLVSELDAFAHTVAHDLKSPIGVIAGNADILVGHHQSMPPNEVDEALTTIVARSLKMADIVDSLLMLASVRGMAGVAVAPLDMSSILKAVLLRLDQTITEKQAVITTASTWPEVVSYAPWIEEILVNYISNALKYGGSPPLVKIDAQPLEGHMIRFNVTDNGPGMTTQDTARLFTPFTRLESAKRAEGHGLGLSIVERIATRLGGEVGVESEIGKGSTFFFTLPDDTLQSESSG